MRTKCCIYSKNSIISQLYLSSYYLFAYIATKLLYSRVHQSYQTKTNKHFLVFIDENYQIISRFLLAVHRLNFFPQTKIHFQLFNTANVWFSNK